MSALIGVTAGEIYNKVDPWSPVTYGQSRTYTDAVISAGGIPVILPLTADKKTLRHVYDRLDGILFSGGNDVNPKLYGHEPHESVEDISDLRDSQEQQLLVWAMADKKPILAICRGMQMLNVACGGSLHQHIPSIFPDAEDHHSSTTMKNIEHLAHTLKIKSDSKLANILGLTTIKTNTHHHQAVHKLAPNLRAVAWTDDGIIEGLEHDGPAYILGVQSHPESLVDKAEPAWLKLFQSFVQAASQPLLDV